MPVTNPLRYPEHVAPAGWRPFYFGAQLRLAPPHARAVIVISPIARRPAAMALDQLVELAIEEEARASFEITELAFPAPVTTCAGLSGYRFEVVGYTRPYRPVERRLYIIVGDAGHAYAVAYVAVQEDFKIHVGELWTLVESIQPVQGAW